MINDLVKTIPVQFKSIYFLTFLTNIFLAFSSEYSIAQKVMQNQKPRENPDIKFGAIAPFVVLKFDPQSKFSEIFTPESCNLLFSHDSLTVMCLKEPITEQAYLLKAQKAYGKQDSLMYKAFIAKWNMNKGLAEMKFFKQINKLFKDIQILQSPFSGQRPYTMLVKPRKMNPSACGINISDRNFVIMDFSFVIFKTSDPTKVLFEAYMSDAFGMEIYYGPGIVAMAQRMANTSGIFYSTTAFSNNIQETYGNAGILLGRFLNDYYVKGILPKKLR